ncbi:hypothetical protein ACFQGT_03885 [Natrialbaceae archaeon GCM10025810]|uniref:hypothetical protein n=1 Tax=Halovalidus salilacus TaxID=3075124 RepID=UPI003623A360
MFVDGSPAIPPLTRDATDVTVRAGPVEIPVGTGNRDVLETVADHDRPVVVEARPFSERNHVGSDVESMYASFRERAFDASPDGIDDAVCDALSGSGPSDRDSRSGRTGERDRPGEPARFE